MPNNMRVPVNLINLTHISLSPPNISFIVTLKTSV